MKQQVIIKSWTKSEMIDKIFEQCKWRSASKEENKKRAMRKTYDRIWEVFTAFNKDKENYLFYANLLTA